MHWREVLLVICFRKIQRNVERTNILELNHLSDYNIFSQFLTISDRFRLFPTNSDQSETGTFWSEIRSGGDSTGPKYLIESFPVYSVTTMGIKNDFLFLSLSSRLKS